MHNILIVGNLTKDVYLQLDNHHNHFESDENGVSWLDLAFNGSSHRFFSRTSIYGGAAASFEGNIKGEGNLVTVKTTLKLNKRVYEASDWFSFRKAVNMAKSYNRYFVAKKR